MLRKLEEAEGWGRGGGGREGERRETGVGEMEGVEGVGGERGKDGGWERGSDGAG